MSSDELDPQLERTSFLYARVLSTDKERWIQAAQLAKLTLDDWVTNCLNAAAKSLKKTADE